MPALSNECRYLILLAKVQNKVEKNEDALLSLEKVSSLFSLLSLAR